MAGADSLLLTRLYLVSLLKQEEDRRYQLHPLVGQFARELLQADPVMAKETEQRHADYYLSWFAERAAAFKDMSRTGRLDVGACGSRLRESAPRLVVGRTTWSQRAANIVRPICYCSITFCAAGLRMAPSCLQLQSLLLATEPDDPEQMALRSAPSCRGRSYVRTAEST